MPDRVTLLLTPPERGVPTGSLFALTPAAVKWAAERGANAPPLDDVWARPAHLLQDLDLLRWFVDWTERLAQLTADVDSVVVARQLLYAPLCSLMVASAQVHGILAATRATHLTVVEPRPGSAPSPWHDGHLQFWPVLGDRPLVAEVAPIVAAAEGITCFFAAGAPFPRPPSADQRLSQALRRSAVRAIGPRRRARPHARGSRREGAGLWTWAAGYGIERLDAEEAALGRRRAYLRRGGASTSVLEPSRPWRRFGPSLPLRLGEIPAEDALLRPFLAEVDARAGAPGLGDVLERRLRLFVHGVAPAVSRVADGLAGAFEAAGVDAVHVTNPSSIEEFSALVAGRRLGLPRTLHQHGDHLMPYDFWAATETPGVTLVEPSDPTVPADLADACRAIGVAVPSFGEAAVRTRATRTAANGGRRDAPVFYVPSILTGESVVIGGGYIDSAWYHAWHLRLVEAMARRADTSFVWKALPSADQHVDPMRERLSGGRFPNITYVTDPLPMVIERAGRALIDFPSTPLYEAVRAGIPTLAIVFTRFTPVRPRAVRIFEPIVRPCADTDDAIAEVVAFLAADPRAYKVPPSRLAAAPAPDAAGPHTGSQDSP